MGPYMGLHTAAQALGLLLVSNAAGSSAAGSSAADSHVVDPVDHAFHETFERLVNEAVEDFAASGGASSATITGTLEAMRLSPDALAVAMLAGYASVGAAPFCVGDAEGLSLSKTSELAPLDFRGAIDLRGIDEFHPRRIAQLKRGPL